MTEGSELAPEAGTDLVGHKHTHGVDESKHTDDTEAHDELEGISVEFEVHWLGVEDGSHQVTFSCIEPCMKTCHTLRM